MIDCEYPASGDPAMDLAYWDYFRHSSFHNPTGAALPTEWLLEGYQHGGRSRRHSRSASPPAACS